MKHEHSRRIFSYWTSILKGRAAPTRSEVDPSQIRTMLANTFILDIETPGREFFRLAGTRMCALYRRELKNSLFSEVWAGEEYQAIAEILESMRKEGSCAVVSSSVREDVPEYAALRSMNSVPMETILMPLTVDGGAPTRCLGCQVPLETPYWIGHANVRPNGISEISPLVAETAALRAFSGSVRAADENVMRFDSAMVMPAGVVGRRVGHLTVIDCNRL